MTVLVTGFEPYGGMPANPAAATAQALDGRSVAGHRIAGVVLPVSLKLLGATLGRHIAVHRPAAILCLGLYPGEAVIRIERVGLNLADFALADNEGVTRRDTPLEAEGPAARFTTLPARAIAEALIARGTPARLSQTAGTYLCNACLYAAVGLSADSPAGFLHVPMTPDLVALGMAAEGASAFDRDPPPSMDLARIIDAAETAIAVTFAPAA